MGETVDSATQTSDLGLEFGFDATEELNSYTNGSSPRVVIDTSPPFGSVEEAVIRFGGRGFWIPRDILRSSSAQNDDALDAMKLEEQAGQMLNDLNLKKQETLNVLKDLELTKNAIEQLKLKLLQTKQSDSVAAFQTPTAFSSQADHTRVVHAKNDTEDLLESSSKLFSSASSSPASLVMVELKQARHSLSQSTNELASIRATVESLNRKMDEEKKSCCSVDQTCKRRQQSLEHSQALREEMATMAEKNKVIHRSPKDNLGTVGIARELQELNFEAEQFMKTAEAAKAEVLKAMSDIEKTKTGLKMIEMRWVAAKKMEEAARAAEELALAEIKALSWTRGCREEFDTDSCLSKMQDRRMISLSFEEYSHLAEKARRAENVVGFGRSEAGPMRSVVETADENNRKMMGLEDFMERVQVAANRRNLGHEEATTTRFGADQKDTSARVNNYNHHLRPVEVRNSYLSQSHPHHRDARVIDADELNCGNDQDKTRPILRQTTSIGDILSRKLVMRDDLDLGRGGEDQGERQRVSLNQMLQNHRAENSGEQLHGREIDMETTGESDGRKSGGVHHSNKHFFSKRLKSLGFVHVSLPLSKQSKSKIQALHLW